MSAVPFLDLSRQYKTIKPDIERAVRRVFDSQRFIMGEVGKRFEEEMAHKTGAKYAIAVASGSDALYLTMLGLGIGANDEVITTSFTFFATAGAISRLGARPVFADIDRRTFNLDPQDVERKITKKTKAILPVHLFGLPCDMAALQAIAKKYGLFVIEDAAQAFGAAYQGSPVGSLGDAAAFSFYPTKNLGGAGDGGLVTTSSKPLAEKIKKLRDHGQSKKYFHAVVGLNSRLDEIQAAVLLVKLKHIDRWNDQRRRHAQAYDKAFADIPPLERPSAPKGMRHVYHLYSVLTSKRDEFAAFLAEKGIGAGVYYPIPMHLQPCYKSLGGKPGDLPVSECVSGEILSLPMYPELSGGDRKKVIDAVQTFFGRKKK
ncbi:MAG: DegT/DnrJ/EryC1/StrS family aminotransferase [Candidatus Omnitrophica bacterium]|nr:DegT/DnrJ/EryC1/StrS family aminotransferase [Candidatus Omnitrophota bacterium]